MSERRLVASVRRQRPSMSGLMAEMLTSLPAEATVEEALVYIEGAPQMQKVFPAISQGQDLAFTSTISVGRSLCGELMPQRVLT